jgi:hypothetical protein
MTTVPSALTRPPQSGIAGPPLLAAAVAVGPLSVAADQLVLPYGVTADGPEAVGAAAAHPAAMQAVLWLDLLGCITLLAGVLVACLVATRGAPRLGVAAAVASAVGFGAMALTAISFDLVAASAGTETAAAARVLDTALAQPVATVGLVAFLGGQLVALVLLGAAVRRTAPRWAAVALVVSGPLHVVFPGVVPSAVAGALTWVLTAVALVAVVLAARGVRTGVAS